MSHASPTPTIDQSLIDLHGELAQQFHVARFDIICQRCGCLFSVPKQYAEGRMKSGRVTFCPNGHKLDLSVNADKSPACSDEELKAMHRAEQLEAKLADAQEQIANLTKSLEKRGRKTSTGIAPAYPPVPK